MTRCCSIFVALAVALAVHAAELPITNVVLFSSGVGYFQRAGSVKGNDTVRLTFKAEQINDLLKSLMLLDLDGGRIGSVTYGAKDPISKTLQSFAVNITDNPSLADLLNRLRGVEIEVTATNVITGKILGVETRVKHVKDEVYEFKVLNLLTATGIRAVNLDEVASFKILDERLNTELQNALQVLASGLDIGRKPVVVSFNGEKTRRVLIGYLVETPIWKTSYRLVTDEKTAQLQGWGIVENTSDDDWTNVRLSLVSGRPISFVQDLYTSLYIPRPVFRPQLFASLGPVSYDDGVPEPELMDRLKDDTPGLRGPAGPEGKPAPAPSMKAQAGRAGEFLSLDGNIGTFSSREAQASVVSAALARDLGQGFEYAIKTPVTLPRQQSALLPIVTAPVETKKISIYNPNVDAKHALYGMKVKNTTGMHLMGGPITIYEQGVYGGDATFENLEPGETRMISYAVDLGMTPQQKLENAPERITAVKIVKGMMTATRKYRRTTSYLFMPKDGKTRTVVVEHPFIQGWTLAEPKEAEERTDTLYRFTLPVDGKTGGKLAVVEEYVQSQAYALVGMDTGTLLMYATSAQQSPAVRDALKRAAELQDRVIEAQRKRQQDEQEIATITREQQRIRENMNALDRNSDLYKRLVKKLDEQETRIEQLRVHIEEMRDAEVKNRKEYENYVNGLDLEAELK